MVVISVTIDQGKPFARALRTSSAMYEGATLAGQVDTLEYGTKVYSWPGAATTLLALFPGAAPLRPAADPAGPLAPGKLPAKDSTKEGTPFYKSGWFWGTLGGVAAVGLTVFILSKTTSNTNTVHIDGTVSP
ncbi:MAG: hypothetical protein U0359_36025 [Byssovorax sp.]